MNEQKNTAIGTNSSGELLKIKVVVKIENIEEVNQLIQAGFKIMDIFHGEFILGSEDKDAIASFFHNSQ
jgi:hypothetical protein